MAMSVDDQLFLEHISPIVPHHHHPYNEVFRGPGGENVAPAFDATESRAGLITAFLTVTVFYARALLTGAHHGPHHGSHHRALPETVREGPTFSGPEVTLHPSLERQTVW